MLAQVSRVTEEKIYDLTQSISDISSQPMPTTIRTMSDVFVYTLEMLNDIQQVISSVSYPDIAVSPIAVYREVDAIQ
jgi:hypothetical protein